MNGRDQYVHRVARNIYATHCKRGHPKTPENLYVSPRGRRFCKPCIKIRNRARYADVTNREDQT